MKALNLTNIEAPKQDLVAYEHLNTFGETREMSLHMPFLFNIRSERKERRGYP